MELLKFRSSGVWLAAGCRRSYVELARRLLMQDVSLMRDRGVMRDLTKAPIAMFDVSATVPFVGISPEFLKSEILRVGASPAEIRSAISIVARSQRIAPRAFDRLTPRMRRLVDLLVVAGDHIVVPVETTEAADPTQA